MSKFLKSFSLTALFALSSFLGLAEAEGATRAVELHGTIVTDETVRITWLVDCEKPNAPSEIVIRYNRAAVLANEGDVWLRADAVPYSDGSLELRGLNAASSYVYQLGYETGTTEGADAATMTWSNRQYFETKTPWGFTRMLLMLGSLSLFIYGMKTMSEGIQASAGVRLRKILESMTKNRVTGVLSGFFLTGLLQSSSATTVMTVSFVNAGLITLVQSAGIMMGANIGTTVTGWLVSYLGFRIDITIYALVVLAMAIPLLLIKKSEFKAWATALIGFALIFMGLGFLKDTVPVFTQDSAIVTFFAEFSNIPVIGVLMFIALGAIITIIIQSSSTAITLTMALCATGVIPFEVAAAMVLGENIGTTTTAEIAAVVGNVFAKRSARIHTLFNVIGVCWMVFLIPVVLPLIGKFLPADPFSNTDAGRQAATTGLAAFHTVFNIANLLLLIWFVPALVKIATRTVPSKGGEDEEFRLEYIDTSIQISEISLVEARGEVAKFGEITARMSGFVRKLLIETDEAEQTSIHKRIRKYEKITDRLELEIAEYCGQLSRTELSKSAADQVSAILSISNDLERIGDIFYQMSSTIERKIASKIWFTPDQRAKLMAMFDLLDKSMAKMVENLKKEETDAVDLETAKAYEKELNKMRNNLRIEYLDKIESGNYNLRSGTIFSDLFSSLEKVGDHILNVSKALVGKL